MGQIQQKRQQRHHRNNANDGSLSDSNYATYSELMQGGGGKSVYPWLQPASTYAGFGQEVGGEELAGSRDSLHSVSSSIKTARAHSLTRANLLAHQLQQVAGGQAVQRQEEETEYYGVPFLLGKSAAGTPSRFTSQPASPTGPPPPPLMGCAASPAVPAPLTYSSLPSFSSAAKQRAKLCDSVSGLEQHKGSNLSETTSVYSSQEERTNADIALLQRELLEEHRKVLSLTSQLNTNAHVVSAFEQSLANMTARLQQITKTAERKDAELQELRRTIDILRQSGVDAGLIRGGGSLKRQDSGPNGLMRQMSTDSVTSISSAHSSSSLNHSGEEERERVAGKKNQSGGGPKRAGWLRSSFSKAFSRGKGKNKGGSVSDGDDSTMTSLKDPLAAGTADPSGYVSESGRHAEGIISVAMRSSSPLSSSRHNLTSLRTLTNAKEAEFDDVTPQLVVELKRALMEKDTLLTETRLEALSSAHQLESLRDTVSKMKSELMSLRHDNEKLQTQVVSKSLGSSESSLNTTSHHEADNSCLAAERRLSALGMVEMNSLSGPSTLDLSITTDPSNQDSKLVSVVVELSEMKQVDGEGEEKRSSLKIGNIAANGKLSWELLDSLMERLFKEYVMLGMRMMMSLIGNMFAWLCWGTLLAGPSQCLTQSFTYQVQYPLSPKSFFLYV
jgi:neuron navigator 2